MFGAQCYFDEEVWESQGLVRASLEAMLGAWCWRKPTCETSSFSHFGILSNDCLFVISYTSIAPLAPW